MSLRALLAALEVPTLPISWSDVEASVAENGASVDLRTLNRVWPNAMAANGLR